jgi:hypothetical protein
MKSKTVLYSIFFPFVLLVMNKINSEQSKYSALTVPQVYYKIYGASSLVNDGTFITIKSNGVPDHTSPYHSVSNSLYEAFAGTTPTGNTFVKNPNAIAAQSFTFKILNPMFSSNHGATPLGPIGVSLNGVPLYNQYAGPNNTPLTSEIASFDKYNGHPQATGQYHYHFMADAPYLNGSGYYGTQDTITQ